MPLMKNERTVAMLAGAALLALLLTSQGCRKNDGGAPSAGAPGDPALVAAGKTVFDTNGCARCHAIGGQVGGRAPDLTHVGADAAHTPQWLAEHVKNPRSQNPSSRMPAFGGKISDQDLLALGTYLASLK
jgi:mono/diheme cytochrome c family protein